MNRCSITQEAGRTATRVAEVDWRATCLSDHADWIQFLTHLTKGPPCTRSPFPNSCFPRVVERRGRVHLFEAIDPARTALLVVDLQNGFMVPGQPAEIAFAREIVPNVNRIAGALARGGRNGRLHPEYDYRGNEARMVDVVRQFPRRRHQGADDRCLPAPLSGTGFMPISMCSRKIGAWKSSASAPFVEGSSGLDRMLKAKGIDTLIITGTATNVCCESTARDAMMMNYKVIFVSDANACRTMKSITARSATSSRCLAMCNRPTMCLRLSSAQASCPLRRNEEQARARQATDRMRPAPAGLRVLSTFRQCSVMRAPDLYTCSRASASARMPCRKVTASKIVAWSSSCARAMML